MHRLYVNNSYTNSTAMNVYSSRMSRRRRLWYKQQKDLRQSVYVI